MASGRITALRVHLTPEDRQTLLAWQQSTRMMAGRARRARILLLAAEGVPLAHIARMVGINRPHVYKWVRRFLAAGVAGLVDRPPGFAPGTPRGRRASARPTRSDDRADGDVIPSE